MWYGKDTAACRVLIFLHVFPEVFRVLRIVSRKWDDLANLLAILLVSATAYAFLGICVIVITIFLGYGNPLLFLAVLFVGILGAGVFATACTSFIGLFAAHLVYRSGQDPDSIIPPLTTTIGDLLGIVCVASAIFLIAILFGGGV